MPIESPPKMELANDLNTVIAIYSTTQITFSLLTIDTSSALRLYRAYLWRLKASYESRGLMVDDDVVLKAGWFAYYLIQNRTFFGRKYTYDIWGGEEKGQLAIFIGVLDRKLLVQRPDRQVEWGGHLQVVGFSRRIVYTEDEVLVTEDGALYIAPNLSRPESSVAGILQAVIVDPFVYTLARDGLVRSLHGTVLVNSEERIVSEKYRYDDGSLRFRTSRGTVVGFDPDSWSIVSRSDSLTLTFNITPELRLITGRNPTDIKPIKAIRLTPLISQGWGNDNKTPLVLIDTNRSLILVTKSATQVNYRGAVQKAIAFEVDLIELILDT